MKKFIVTCSGGNDSIALIQFMQENHKGDFEVLYNDTGWARDDWPRRIKSIADKCFNLGIPFHITKSEGMINLVKRKKGWPMPASAMQWCTQELKEKPSNEFYEKQDPDHDLVIVTGRRRAESQNRANLSKWQLESEKHGGRDVYNPLINFDESERDIYIRRFGFEPLPHQSMECYPCVCANKTDLSQMPADDPRIDLIEKTEIEMGFTKNKKPRTMFRPYRVGGGVGIRQAVEWGHGKRGWKAESVPETYEYNESKETTEGGNDIAYSELIKDRKQCDGGFCGG
jgi:3'-phosphoadenosine 5'-phosphosulfate sulfotransferase (PAPS reductase)/FAD synthetase